VTVNGWKLWGFRECATCSPLSALIAPIHTDDRVMTRREGENRPAALGVRPTAYIGISVKSASA
jgi:hypothetical protein